MIYSIVIDSTRDSPLSKQNEKKTKYLMASFYLQSSSSIPDRSTKVASGDDSTDGY